MKSFCKSMLTLGAAAAVTGLAATALPAAAAPASGQAMSGKCSAKSTASCAGHAMSMKGGKHHHMHHKSGTTKKTPGQ